MSLLLCRVLSFVLMLAALPALAAGLVRTDLYVFPGTGPFASGNSDAGGLVSDAAGNLYGVTQVGYDSSCSGNVGCGTIYKLVRPKTKRGNWTRTTLYQFTGGVDGAFPNASLIFGSDGGLYATAHTLKSQAPSGSTVWRLSPPATKGGAWTLTTLTSALAPAQFAPGLYITPQLTIYGVDMGFSRVFALVPPAPGSEQWTFSNVMSIAAGALGGIAGDGLGNLFGVSGAGGNGFGTVYELMPTKHGTPLWKLIQLYAFTGKEDGHTPQVQLTVGPNGTSLFGVTSATFTNCATGQCGSVFSLQRHGKSWTETTLHSFTPAESGGVNGKVLVSPNGRIVYGSNITATGSYGTAYRLAKAGGQAVWSSSFYAFQKDASCNPMGNLVFDAIGKNPIGTASTIPGSVFTLKFQ